MTSPQQEAPDKKNNNVSSIRSHDDSDKKTIETKPPTIEEQEEGDTGNLGGDSFLPSYPEKDDRNNVEEKEEEKMPIDYMAKDYASFRNALLDLIPRKIPQWKDRSEADMGIMLIELFSYVADELSYVQDRVANEAFLRTARARSSVSNHLRLIDYHMQNGRSANTLIKVKVKNSAVIPAGFQISTVSERGEEEETSVIIFETLKNQRVDVANNEVGVIYKIKSDNNNSAGITTLSAILKGHLEGLKKGQHVLLFQKGVVQAKDHQVRSIITRQSIVKLWEDSKIIADTGGSDNNKSNNNNNTFITWEKGTEYPESPITWKGDIYCCANILKATHGRTVRSEVLKEKNQEVSKFSFTLKEGPLTFASDDSLSSAQPTSTLKVWVDGQLWEETDSLLTCGPFDQKFSISIDDDGYATVFFGNGKCGLKPKEDSIIEAEYRVGIGSVGNVGKDSLTQFTLGQNPSWLVEEVIERATNPFPATGGIDIESMDDAKIAGPKSLNALERAVTLKDYEDLVKREFQNDITNARARFVYTGSWDTIFVSIDLKGGQKNVLDGDEDYYGIGVRIREYLDRIRMIGYEVQIEEAKYVPIIIEITVCLEKYLDSGIVRSRILYSLANKGNIANGGKGLFHPDNFTFGDPVYASKIYEVLEKAPEVKYGIITIFRKMHNGETISQRDRTRSSIMGHSSSGFPSPHSTCTLCTESSIADRDEETRRNLELGSIPVGENEIITIDSDPSHLENGFLILNFVTENGDQKWL